MKNIKIGDKVIYKNDPNKEIYTVYAIYSKNRVSLGLKNYLTTEQDYMCDIKYLEIIDK